MRILKILQQHLLDHKISSKINFTNYPSQSINKSGEDFWSSLLISLSHLRITKLITHFSSHILLLLLIALIITIIPQYLQSYTMDIASGSAFVASIPTSTPTMAPAILSQVSDPNQIQTISRNTVFHTIIPSRPRFDVILYEVKPGDTLFGIAEQFGLKPETILWGNQLILGDNPHNLRPGQQLNILPVDGTYYRWQTGDGLNGVAKFFGVEVETIINWPGNRLDANTIGDYAQPNIEAGTWLIIPGGKRAYVTWSAPDIPRDNPGVAKVLGPGACESIPQGAIGSGVFIWPAINQFLSGYDWSPETNHFGIDIDGETGDSVFASDSGVIVYAGWNNWGYGNVVVINHGNGWQTLYAHLNDIYVGCGQSVSQGSIAGSIGETGNASGSHLHFEMMFNGTKVNPWNYLP